MFCATKSDSSSAIKTPDTLPKEVLKTMLWVETFFRPVMDVMRSATERSLNDDCLQPITQISSVFPVSPHLDGKRKLANIALLNAICVLLKHGFSPHMRGTPRRTADGTSNAQGL